MKENGYCFKHLNILLALLDNDVRSGSLRDIIEQSGYRHKDTEVYTSKKWLIEEGILIPNGDTNIKYGFGEKQVTKYKVKRGVILSILCAEWNTKVLYKDLINSKISVLPAIKPRKQKN